MKNNPKIKIIIPNASFPFILDLLCRIGLSVLYGYWDTEDSKERLFVFGIQVLFYLHPFVMVGFLILRDQWVDKIRKMRFERIKNQIIDDVEFKDSVNWVAYALVTLALIHFFALNYYLLGTKQAVESFLMVGLNLGYFASLLFLFGRGIFNEKQVLQSIQAQTDKWDDPSADDNNERIISLESQLTSIQQRLEGYILESALLGGLAFSGFLQILSQNIITVNDLSEYGNHVAKLFQYLVKGNGTALIGVLSQMTNQKDLFCLISAQSLVCSVFFLLVIASRMRYADLSDKIRHTLALAHDANEKEDVLFSDSENLSEFNQERLRLFSQKITESISTARQTFLELTPVLDFMRLFRNLGVATFFIVVLTSALFIAGWLTVFCLVMFIGAQLYFRREDFKSLSRGLSVYIRKFLDEYNILTLVGAITLFVIGNCIAFWGYVILGVTLSSMGCAILILVRQLNLWIPSQSSQPVFWDQSTVRSLIIRSISLFGEALICISIVIRMVGDFQAWSSFWFVGTLFLLTYIVGYVSALKYSLPFRILTGIGLFIFCFGILFKIFYWPGGNDGIMLGNGLLSIGGLFSLRQMKFIHWARWLVLLFFFVAPFRIVFNTLNLPGEGEMRWITFATGVLAFGTSVFFISGKKNYKYLLLAIISAWFIGMVLEEINRNLWGVGILLQISAFLGFLLLESCWGKTGFNFQRGLIVRYVILLTCFNFIGGIHAVSYLRYKIQKPNSLIVDYKEYHDFFYRLKPDDFIQKATTPKMITITNQRMQKWKILKQRDELFASNDFMARELQFMSQAFRRNTPLKSAQDTAYYHQVLKWTEYSAELDTSNDVLQNHIEHLKILGNQCNTIRHWAHIAIQSQHINKQEKKWFQSELQKCKQGFK